MAARVALVALAAGLLVFGIAARRDTGDCKDAGRPFLRVEFGKESRVSAKQVRAFADACRGTHRLALGANFLAARGQSALGIELARTATRREPENFEGWIALSRALKAADLNASAATALRRAVALNPRLGRTPPQPG